MSDPEVLGTIVLSVCAAVSVTFIRVYRLDHDFRHRWPRRQPAAIESADAYRGASITPPLVPGQAPALVRNTALLSTWLGCMFIPGLLAGLVGLAAGGVGGTCIPGLIISARCWHSGGLLLAADPAAPASARSTARWSAALNALIVVLCCLTFLVLAFERGHTDSSVSILATFTLAYALLSLAHASLLNRSAAIVERAITERGEQLQAEMAGGLVSAPVAA